MNVICLNNQPVNFGSSLRKFKHAGALLKFTKNSTLGKKPCGWNRSIVIYNFWKTKKKK